MMRSRRAPARLFWVFLLGGLVAAIWSHAAAQVRVELPKTSGETSMSATCMLAVMAATARLQRDFKLQQVDAAAPLIFDDIFLQQYSSIGCYEDGDGFILYFRPLGYKGGASLKGTYMFRMARDHTIQYAAPLR